MSYSVTATAQTYSGGNIARSKWIGYSYRQFDDVTK